MRVSPLLPLVVSTTSAGVGSVKRHQSSSPAGHSECARVCPGASGDGLLALSGSAASGVQVDPDWH
jgi:hypothetical protein